MAISQPANVPYLPLSGPFGFGNIQIFSRNGDWVVPPGINRVRARLWGGGGGGGTGGGGSGGGFSIVVVENLVGIESIPILVGIGGVGYYTGGGTTSSFGVYASATGGFGSTSSPYVGYGVGGYINNNGGVSSTSSGGGGAASIMGPGGSATLSSLSQGGAGAGNTPTAVTQTAQNGFLGRGATSLTTSGTPMSATSGFEGGFSIDFIGMGGGASNVGTASNGGGGAYTTSSPATYTQGSFPGGGGGGTGSSGSFGGNGLVIVEW